MSNDSESKAYDEGTTAYGDGVSRDANPHDGKADSVREARQWFAGFDEAESNDPLGDPDELEIDPDEPEDDEND